MQKSFAKSIYNLIKYSTLNNFINKHKTSNAMASLISTNLDNPKGYGRIVKDKNNQLVKIVEHKDASEKQLEICEINSGVYIFNSKF